LILTSNYERPFHSEIGSPIRSLMFENPSPMLAITMKKAILDMVTNLEPRVEVIEVTIDFLPDNNSITVTIEFKIVNTEQPLTVDFILERTR